MSRNVILYITTPFIFLGAIFLWQSGIGQEIFNFNPLSAQVGFLRTTIEETSGELKKNQEIVFSLKEQLRNEQELRKELELKYKSEIGQMTEKVDNLAETIDVLHQQILEIVKEREIKKSEELAEAEKDSKEISKETDKEEDKEEKKGEEVIFCQRLAGDYPLRNEIIINEIAWMGTQNSANHEWIELKNVSNREINFEGWQIQDKDQKIKIIFKEKRVPIGGFWLLERTSNDSAADVAADLIYIGALKNENEALYLFNQNCQLQDEVLAAPNWPAGDNASKRTMERKWDLTWQASANPGGTPKRENSAGYVEIVQRRVGGGGGGAGTPAPTPAPAPDPEPTIEEIISALKILISEVQITGGPGKTENDFIELYNPTGQDVYLGNYGGGYIQLVKRTKTGQNNVSIKSWRGDAAAKIYSQKHYLWASSEDGNYPSSIDADVWTKQSISEDNGIALLWRRGDESFIIDAVGWGEFNNVLFEKAPFPQNPEKNQSLGRKWDLETQKYQDADNNSQDFEIQTPTPKVKNKTFTKPESETPNPPQNPPADTAPPVRTDGQPAETLPSGTTQADISLKTDEAAVCKYSTTSGTDYDSIADIFSNTNSTFHSTLITGLNDDNTYNFYIRCVDAAGNKNTDDFIITFNVAVPEPPSPNLLLNEFFEEWDDPADSAGYLHNWNYSGTATHITRDEDGFVGNYSVRWTPITTAFNLTQTGITVTKAGTYYAEIWIKPLNVDDSNYVRIALDIADPADGSFPRASFMDYKSEAGWVKITKTRNIGMGKSGGMRIRAQRSGTSGSSFLVGAAWLSANKPPENWLQNTTP